MPTGPQGNAPTNHQHSGSGDGGATLTPDTLLDANDGKAWETLREIGYEAGDVVPLSSLSNGSSADKSFTSTTFVNAQGLSDIRIQWDKYAVQPTHVGFSGFLNPGSGEQPSAQVWNGTDGEELTSFTVSSAGASELFDTRWVQYTPTTTGSPIRINPRVKTDSGSNTCFLEEITVHLGVQL